MDDTIFNSSMATSVTLTQAQIVTTAVIGSIILTLVVLNIVMYSIYKKLMQDPKPTIKLGKQESIQLYQMRSTMEYNTLSNSSVSQSQCRTLGGTSYSGEETMSVIYSSADVTRSFSHNRSMCSSSVHESLALETSMEYQVSGTNKSCKGRNQSSSRIIDESECEKIEQESTDSLEIEAQIHDNSLKNSNKPQRLSDIHLYQCIKSQMNQDKIQSGITHEHQKSKPAPGKPLEVNCSREKLNRKVNKELKASHGGHPKNLKDTEVQKSQRKEQPQSKNISKGHSARLSNHHKTQEPESNHLSDSRKRDHSQSSGEIDNQPNSRNHDHLKCSSEIDNQPTSREHDQSRGLREHANSIKSRSSSRGQVHSRGSKGQNHPRTSKDNVHSKSSRQHDLSRSSKEHTHPHNFRIQNEIKGYVDMADFENDTDTEASVLAALDSVQTYQGVQLLTSGEGLMGCPVVEFQNKAFEFSETKTSIEEVDDTDL